MMQQLGIESASFYTSRHFIDLAVLAAGRNVPADKYYIGLGQYQMAVASPDEDIITLAANAAKQALQDIDSQTIGLVLFATESGTDQSKAAGLYIHRLLQLPNRCRVLELKQACYGATGAIMLALDWLKSNPDKKALILASDIARYGLGSAGEPSQGGGAVALVLSNAPKLIAFEEGSGIYTEEAMDFWRPNYRDEALVDGKYSCELYLKALKESWLDYQTHTHRNYADHDYFLFHIPIPRLAEKALQKLALVNQLPRPTDSEIELSLADSLRYSRTVGNCYTASLYLGLLSLLEHRDDLAGKRLGFYSYGSGCIGEFFSARVLPNYTQHLFTKTHQALLAAREALNLQEYEAAYQYAYPKDGGHLEIPKVQRGIFRLAQIKDHQRVYEAGASLNKVSAQAPAKLILCGEHAILQGVPAIAMAINIHCKSTISTQSLPHVLFDLANLDHKRERTLHHLRHFKAKVQADYQQFMQGKHSIRKVLTEPFHLLEYTATAFIDKLKLKMQDGLSVHTHSDIPSGYGMGSSAAAIVSLNFALNHYTGKNLSLDELFHLNLDAENLQHGQSSGLDIYVSAHGGCIYFCHDKTPTPLTWPDFPFTLILTGKPSSTTGECVSHTQAIFKKEPQRIAAFHEVSQRMLSAIQEADFDRFKQAIADNQSLLESLDVVPAKVQSLIQTLRQAEIAAKICGAGAISGDAAGVVIAFASIAQIKQALPNLEGLELRQASLDMQGVRII